MSAQPVQVTRFFPTPDVVEIQCGAVDGLAVFTLARKSFGSGQLVVRVDLTTGAQTESAALPRMTCPVVAFDSLWVAGGSRPSELWQLDAATLQVRRTISLPASSEYALASTPAAIWVVMPTEMLRIDPASGAVQLSVPLERGVERVDAIGAADGSAIYVSEYLASGRTVVEQRDPTSGSLVARSTDVPTVGGLNFLYADSKAAWMGYSTGMMGALSELQPTTLRELTHIPGFDAAWNQFPNSFVAVADRRHVVVGSILGETLDCYDTQTGTLRVRLQSSAMPIALDATDIIVEVDAAWPSETSDPSGIEVVAISDGC